MINNKTKGMMCQCNLGYDQVFSKRTFFLYLQFSIPKQSKRTIFKMSITHGTERC